jgi:phosphoglycolate phosphatase-like HAD superfamily hydrolase
MKKLIVFDFDDTLICSSDFVAKNVIALASDLNLAQDLTNIYEVLKRGMLLEPLFQELFGDSGEELLAKYRARVEKIPIPPCFGALELIKDLKSKGFLVGILTNRVRLIEKRIADAGFDINDFSFIFAPKEKKPSAGSYDEVMLFCETLGIKREEIFSVGDSIADFTAAVANKIDFCAVTTGLTTIEDFEKVDAKIVREIRGIYELVA